MKAQSDTPPPEQTMSRGKTQVNYNVQEVKITDGQGTQTVYEYDYVTIVGNVTKAKVLAAMKAEELEDDPKKWTPSEVATEHANMVTALADLKKPHTTPASIAALRDRVDLIEAMLGIIPD